MSVDQRAAVVTAVNPGPPPTVTIQVGGDTATDYDAPYLATYTPAVGDNVTTLSRAGAHLVLGTGTGAAGHVEFINLSPTGFNTTSLSYVTVPTSTSGAFVKTRDNTRVRVDVDLSGYVLTASAKPGWGIRASLSGGGNLDYDLTAMLVNTVSNHTGFSGKVWLTGLVAGNYTFTLLAQRLSGTGVVAQDSNDYIIYEADETP
jgi:hypothetical protein